MAEKHIRPTLLSVITYECQRYAAEAFNLAISEALEESPALFDDLYEVRYGEDGSVLSVTEVPYAVNAAQSCLTRRMEKQLTKIESRRFSVPVGSLLGMQALVGRGPRMPFWIMPESYVMAHITGTLESAGVNQTLLVVEADFTLNLSVVMSGYSTTVEVQNTLPLARIVIVGKVPQSYFSRGTTAG